jgi:hypothetical protein
VAPFEIFYKFFWRNVKGFTPEVFLAKILELCFGIGEKNAEILGAPCFEIQLLGTEQKI